MPNNAAFLEQMNLFTQEPTHPPQTDTINNVYELPSIGRALRYLHAATGFPTNATWIKAIRKGNYLSWPLINVQNVSKHFLESEETQKGHMRNQWQGVQSTKSHQATQTNDYKRKVKEKKKGIFIAVHDPKSKMYTDQTGKLPVRSSRGQ